MFRCVCVCELNPLYQLRQGPGHLLSRGWRRPGALLPPFAETQTLKILNFLMSYSRPERFVVVVMDQA